MVNIRRLLFVPKNQGTHTVVVCDTVVFTFAGCREQIFEMLKEQFYSKAAVPFDSAYPKSE